MVKGDAAPVPGRTSLRVEQMKDDRRWRVEKLDNGGGGKAWVKKED